MQTMRQDAGLVRGLQHHRTSAIAKQNRRATIVPVEDARENLGPDHQRGTVLPGANEGIGRRQGIDKTTADRLQIECGTLLDTELGL